MLKKFLLILITLLLSSCNKMDCSCDFQKSQIIKNDSILNLNSVNIFQTNYWKRFDEPLLQTDRKESYRFSIKRISDKKLHIYRVSHVNNKYILNRKEYLTHGTLKDGTAVHTDSLIYNEIKYLSKEDWNKIKLIVNNNCFWTIPIIEDKRKGLEGSIWIFESYLPKNNNCTNRKYHLISVWSPTQSPFRKICTEFYKIVDKAGNGSSPALQNPADRSQN